MLIPFRKLFNKYPSFRPKGVLHIGAHEGQEIPEYHNIGIRKMIFVEANPDIYQRLLKRSVSHKDIICFNECISDVDGQEVTFKITNNDGQSSSFLELGTHKQMHPDVSFIKEMKMKTVRIDTLLDGLDSDYDMLNIDLQGAEGFALRGMGDLLKQFKYLYLECNTTEVYEGCMQLPEMDEFLKAFGFTRVETFFPGNCTWGDSLYLHKSVML